MGQDRRISDLAAATGVPVATIKYYLRVGLLPEGHRLTARLSEYGEQHVRRLALLRILREVGRVPIEGLRGLVEAATRPGTVHELFAAAADAISPRPPAGGELRPFTRQLADQILDQAGWTHVRPSPPTARTSLPRSSRSPRTTPTRGTPPS